MAHPEDGRPWGTYLTVIYLVFAILVLWFTFTGGCP